MDDFFKGEKSPGMIDWSAMPTYNTIMAVAAGAALIALAMMLGDLRKSLEGKPFKADGYSMAFGALGLILVTTGFHMTTTWPLAAGGFAYDNIIFGETCLGFGALLIFACFYLWKRRGDLMESEDAYSDLLSTAKPLSIFAGGLGLGLWGCSLAGVMYRLFTAPPQEPISGFFAAWPWFEAIFMSAFFFVIGLACLLFPFGVFRASNEANSEAKGGGLMALVMRLWMICGILIGLFGCLNFYTHIGLIVNTM